MNNASTAIRVYDLINLRYDGVRADLLLLRALGKPEEMPLKGTNSPRQPVSRKLNGLLRFQSCPDACLDPCRGCGKAMRAQHA
jgi:hypothetical protein